MVFFLALVVVDAVFLVIVIGLYVLKIILKIVLKVVLQAVLTAAIKDVIKLVLKMILTSYRLDLGDLNISQNNISNFSGSACEN